MCQHEAIGHAVPDAADAQACAHGCSDAALAAGDGATDITANLPVRPAAPCEPCVDQLVPEAARTAALRSVVASETDPLVTLTHLLRWCRDEHQRLQPLAESPQVQGAVAEHLRPARAAMAAEAPKPGLGARVRAELAAAMTGTVELPVVAIAHQAAQLLDQFYGASLDAAFQVRSPYLPGVGDPIPLDSPDVPNLTALTPTAPPWRLAHRLDETRHVRLAGEWATQFRVVFDYSLIGVLPNALTRGTVLATVHPNRSLTEFDFPRSPNGRSFPIRPIDKTHQQAEIDRLIASAARAHASIVVLPELAVTADISDALQAWVTRPDGPDLLVAGSFHHTSTDGTRHNQSICWVRGRHEPLIHHKFSAANQPVREDIEPPTHPELRIYVTQDHWHLAVVICRDLLNPEAVHTLSEVGANLILVPAMSESLTAFGGAAAQLVGSCQAVVAIANNPAEWAQDHGRAAARPARALFGHPGFGQQIRLVSASDPGPGIATMCVDTGQVGWHPEPSAPLDPARGGARARPGAPVPTWLSSAADENPVAASQANPGGLVRLRPSAVLVLLIPGPGGTQVLLTERASDLRDYPGQLVFPGGALDPHDEGAGTAALREAREEVGLAPDSVQILAELPAIALPETGFLVTAVLAWSESPTFVASTNIAEVTSARFVPLSSVARMAPSASRPLIPEDDPWVEGGCRARLGRMTRTVLDVIQSWVPREDTRGRPRSTTGSATTPTPIPASAKPRTAAPMNATFAVPLTDPIP